MLNSTINEFRGEHAFLSNFYLVRVEVDGLIYPSTEHAYQAQKTLDSDLRQMFMVGTPGQAKRLGQKTKLRKDWEQVKIDCMMKCLRAKFKIPELRNKLAATSPKLLEEGNYWGDTFWGVCKGQGQNHLGKLLMKLRDEIISGVIEQ